MKSDYGKVIFFVTVDWFFCSHFLSRAKAARDAGYDVVVLTHVDRHGSTIEAEGFRLIPLSINRRSMNPLSALKSLFEIVRVYRAESPMIVHHVALKPILLGSLAARLSGNPYVINAVVGGGYALTSRKFLVRLFSPILKSALRLLLNPPESRVVFENSDDLEAFVKAKQVKREAAVLIRGAGVEIENYKAAQNDNTVPLVVLGARLLWDKGIGEFVEAASILHARGYKLRMAILGSSDTDNRASIDEETLLQWERDNKVEFWGYRNDIPDVLASADIACLPSYREGLPKFLLEAMASSLPCVTTDVPGCREAVRDGYNGLLVPARKADALADALEVLLLDADKRKLMGARGRKRVELEFSSEHVIEQTLDLYNEVRTGDLINCRPR